MKHLACLILMCLTLAAAAPAAAEDVDLDIVHRIKDQAFNHSRVMEYVSRIADENGPRVTASPGWRRAAERAMESFREAGASRVALEPWGTFGRGWSWSRIAVQMIEPHATTLFAYPGDWSAASDGPVRGEVVFVPILPRGEEPRFTDLEAQARRIEAWKDAHRGTLRGKVVMMDHPEKFELPSELPMWRYGDDDLQALAEAPKPGPRPPLQWPLVRDAIDKDENSRLWDVVPLEMAADRWMLELELGSRIARFLRDEQVAAVLVASWSGSAGVIRHSDYGSWIDDAPIPPPTAVLVPEHYARIHRLLERKVPVTVEVDVDAEFHGRALPGHNVIAELPGSGRRGEVVMLGAHLDSWHGATGASDNAAGSAVVMEVMRILAALQVPLPRTVRAALWDAEEQCLCGSRGYVAKHFGDPVTMQIRPDHARLSAYFNLDNGGGRIRGVYLQGNDMARPIFDAWFAPFADLGVGTLAIANTRGTDHLAFDAVGLPGFQFVQDPLDYDVNTHHSHLDDVGHLVPGDLMQAAAVMAAAVYFAATRPERMPRKPLPAPLPEKQPLPEILRPAQAQP